MKAGCGWPVAACPVSARGRTLVRTGAVPAATAKRFFKLIKTQSIVSSGILLYHSYKNYFKTSDGSRSQVRQQNTELLQLFALSRIYVIC
jgi:hypothetical protein